MAEAKKPAKATTTKKTTAKKPAEKAVKPTKKAEVKTEKQEEPVKASESPVKPRLYTVRVNSSLNVREGAGKDYRVIRRLEDGDVVSVYEQKDGFGRIGKDEWVMMSFLK